MEKVKIHIDEKEIIGKSGQTILDVARESNIDIPTLCHDDRLKVYGSCGICSVEIEGSPKLIRACATEISSGMRIRTNTEKVISNRKIALELLLTDHTGDCNAPCKLACPSQTDCQGYVGLIANGEYEQALKLIKEQLPLPASIGRVCPHPCEDECRRKLKEEPVAIAWHKRFVADFDLSLKTPYFPEIKPSTGKKVAVIGGGPGGLSAAYYLLTDGHGVTIYDMMAEMGGMLKYGIPEYRLPKKVLDREIDIIGKMGAKFENNTRVGRDISLQTLRDKYDAVYISVGCQTSMPLRCKGEQLEGVIGGIGFLRDITENKPTGMGKKVAVVGGGNVAMDACRSALRKGADEVYIIYRRTEDEMPAEDVEIKEAMEEGIVFKFLTNPIEILGNDNRVASVRLQKMELGKPDESGRRRPVPIEGEEEMLEVDTVIRAIGQYTDLEGFEDIAKTEYDTIISDPDNFSTNLPGVFAGGDAINDNLKIAIQAIADGKNSAKVISGYLDGEDIVCQKPYLVKRDDVTKEEFEDKKTAYRPEMEHLPSGYRKENFEEVVLGFTPQAAVEDAKRCLECGCSDYFECKLINLSNKYKVQPENIEGEKHHRGKEDSHPFILRDPDKCILCGLCVRICDEVMGVTALGLSDRGFDAMVKPAMDTPLKDTNCISCGQCVFSCPTGALQERLPIEKPVPVKAETTDTICAFCSVGCNIRLEKEGQTLLRSLPIEGNCIDGGVLCVKGRFGFETLQNDNRITSPMIKKNNKFEKVTWEEALSFTADNMKKAKETNGSSSLGMSVSDSLTLEEIHASKAFAEDALGTENIFSFNNPPGGIDEVFGNSGYSVDYEEIFNTDLILLIGSSVMEDHPVFGLKIRQAVKESGTKLVTVNPFPTQADEWADYSIRPENNMDFLQGTAAALINDPKSRSDIPGFEEFKKSMEGIKIGDDAKRTAELYGNSENAIIVFDRKFVTANTARMLANISLISGHIGKKHSGLIQLLPGPNSKGVYLCGISKHINPNKLKFLLVLGENLPLEEIEDVDFLAVSDTHFTPTASMADVVFPAASFAESEGTYVSAGGNIQGISRVLPPLGGKANIEIISQLSKYMGNSLKTQPDKTIVQDIEIAIESSGTVSDDAKLYPPGQSEMFLKQPNTNFMYETFCSYLKKEGLDRR